MCSSEPNPTLIVGLVGSQSPEATHLGLLPGLGPYTVFLKFQCCRKILCHHIFIIWTKLWPVGRIWIFLIQIVRFEKLQPLEHLYVVIIYQIIKRMLALMH